MYENLENGQKEWTIQKGFTSKDNTAACLTGLRHDVNDDNDYKVPKYRYCSFVMFEEKSFGSKFNSVKKILLFSTSH